MKQIISIILLLLIPLWMYGQWRDYFITATDTVVDVRIIDSGDKKNCQFFKVEWGENDIRQMYPDKVKEYSIGPQRVYISKLLVIDNTVKPVFVEKLTGGKIPLYYYLGKSALFFIEKDSSFLTAIPKKEGKKKTYRQQLRNIADDCPEAAEAAAFTSYSERSLTRFIDWYEKCESRPFPHFRFGITAGYGFSRLLAPPSSYEPIEMKYKGYYSLGLFMDVPLFPSDFSINAGMNYSRRGYSYNHPTQNTDYDFVANMSSVAMPVLLRYSFPADKYRFFLQSGGIAEYSFHKEAYLYQSVMNGKIINISRTDAFTIDDIRFGFSVGAGCEYRLTRRNFLFFDLSFNQLYGNIKNRGILFTSGINI